MLTKAELAVANLVACGETNESISKRRKTSVRTVANQVAAIMRKLGARSRVHVASIVQGRSSQ
ncbi:MAG: helix-turn-helix transcriptional regulator [Kofleriaceae bacterium]